MSAAIKSLSVEEFERDFFADELREARRTDKPKREQISRQAEALDALVAVAGYSPDLFKGLHVLLGKTRGRAPDEWVRFKDSEAGALLPGDSDVTDGSKAKRWQRWCLEFEAEQARTGKRVMRRQPGKKIVEAGATKKLCSQYLSELAQMVADIDRRAGQIRTQGIKRAEKLRMAALEIFSALPAYDPPPVKDSPKGKPEARPQRLAGNRSRAMNRFLSAAKQLLEEKKLSGEVAIDREVARLQMELEALAAEMRSQVDLDAVVHAGNTEWTETQKGEKLIAINFEAKTQNSRQNEEKGEKILDRAVQYPERDEGKTAPRSVFSEKQALTRSRALDDDVVFAASRTKEESKWSPPADFIERGKALFET
jgi:hypothetical protein